MTDLITGNQIDIAAFDSGIPSPKGQTHDPYGENYVGPSNTGQAKYDLASEAAMLGGIYKAVRNPIGTGLRALEAYGLATATDEERAREANLETSVQKLATLASPVASIPGAIEGGKRLFRDVNNALNPQLVPAGGGPNMRIGKVDEFKPSNVFALSQDIPTVSKKLNAIPDNVNMKQLLELEDANIARANKLTIKDTKRSAQATVTTDPTDVKLYGHGQKVKIAHVPKELGSATGLTKIEGIPHKQIHHELMKDYYAEYVAKARQLVKEGKATKADVINLGFIAKKYGFGLGDNKSAAAFIDKIPHDEGHELMKRMGIQPVDSKRVSGRLTKDTDVKYPGAELTTEKKRISKIDNIDELTQDFEGGIKDIGVPMRDEINSFQDAWDRIDTADRMKLFELRWKRDAVARSVTTKTDPKYLKVEKQYKKFKEKLKADMSKYKEHQKQRLEGISDRRMDELQKAAELSR